MADQGEPEASDSLRVFGAVVAAFRERAGLTQEELASLSGCAQPEVASIEQGRCLPRPDFVEGAEKALDAFGVLRAVARHLAPWPGIAEWFREWALLEEDALNLWVYECRVIPGLLQTEAYARTVFESGVPPLDDEQLENRVRARLDRQRLLEEPADTAFSFVVEEALFLRRVGGVETTRELIDHVLTCARLRNVEVQVMPLVKERHAGDVGPLQLLETPDNQWMAYTEGPRGGTLFTDGKDVGEMLQAYATMRAQALTTDDSVSLLEQLRGAL